MKITDKFFGRIREYCSAAAWSKAVEYSRTAVFRYEPHASDSSKLVAVVKGNNEPAAYKSTLWLEDEDWECECHLDDPCIHVVALAIMARNNSESLLESANDPAASDSLSVGLHYLLSVQKEGLTITRELRNGDERQEFRGSLRNRIAGVQSGRLKGPVPICTGPDFVLDELLNLSDGNIKPERVVDYLRLLSQVSFVWFTDASGERELRVEASVSERRASVECIDGQKGGVIVRLKRIPGMHFLAKGLVLEREADRAVVRPYVVPELSAPLPTLLLPEGRIFSKPELPTLASQLLPALRSAVEVEVATNRLPHVVECEPRITWHLRQEGDTLFATPKIVYGDPVCGEIVGDRFVVPNRNRVPRRLPNEERRLFRELHHSYAAKPGFEIVRRGSEVARFLKDTETMGHSGDTRAAHLGALEARPSIEFQDGRVSVAFSVKGGGTSQASSSISFQQVYRAYRSGSSHVATSDGGWFAVPAGWLGSWGETVAEVLAAQGESGKVPGALLTEVVAFTAGSEQEVPESLESIRLLLREADASIDETRALNQLEARLQATLRPYQRTGVLWLSRLLRAGVGAILADDMGLGKTIQASSVIEGNTLVVAPTSVLVAWKEQLAAFRPDLQVIVYHGTRRSLPKRDSSAPSVVITTYALLRRDRELLSECRWKLVVLDEGQYIKNSESQTAQAAYELQAEQRIVLSGTPIENSYDDLWSICRFSHPGLLPSKPLFRKLLSSNDGRERIRKKLKSFILRREKQTVARELPERTEIVLRAEFGEEEQQLYLKELRSIGSNSNESMTQVLQGLLRLRRLCSSPSLVDDDFSPLGAKLQLFFEQLDSSLSNGHRVLVFSQWTSVLDLIQAEFDPRSIRYSRIDGATKNREQVVREFQQEDGPEVLLLSLKAGGTGLTLTRADHVYLLDPWWNPAVERQAADRAHRIGQRMPVTIYKLVVANTVEERVLKLQDAKREIASMMMEGTEVSGGLGLSEMQELLSE